MTCQMYCIVVQISMLSTCSCSSCVSVNADYAEVQRSHFKFGIMEMNEVLYDNTTKMVMSVRAMW